MMLDLILALIAHAKSNDKETLIAELERILSEIQEDEE